MKRSFFSSINTKSTIFFAFLTVVMFVAAVGFGYQSFRRAANANFIETGELLTRAAAGLINADQLARLSAEGEVDEPYLPSQEAFEKLAQAESMRGMYVFLPDETGQTVLYDVGGHGRTTAQYRRQWPQECQPFVSLFLEGSAVPPLMAQREYGQVFTVFEPIYSSQGELAGYLGADFLIDDLRDSTSEYLISYLTLAGVFLVVAIIVWFVFVNTSISKPLRTMIHAAQEYQVGADNEMETLRFPRRDEIGILAASLSDLARRGDERVKTLDDMTRRAETDSLTNLYNRDSFEWRVDQFLRGAQGDEQLHAFLIINLDQFAHVNDLYGYTIGDETLCRLAQTIKESFRSGDVVARMGGDEFGVLCKGIGSVETIEKKAQALVDEWRGIAFGVLGGSFSTTISIGIALSPDHGASFEILSLRAHEALKEAREQGRDRYCMA